MRFFGRGITGLGLVLLSVILLGCETTEPAPKFPIQPQTTAATPGGAATNGAAPEMSAADLSGIVLHVHDAITVAFSDLVNPLSPIDDTVKEDGTVTLYFNQKFHADGKTIGELQVEIRDRYVPQYFKNLTVSIKTDSRFFSVGGEVHAPNRYVYIAYMTLTRAIDAAGGLTDFAKKSNVQITRANGKTLTVDYNKALKDNKNDVEIYPNDKITVKKRGW